MHQSMVKQSPAKILTKAQMSGKYLEAHFTKIMWQVHLTTLPFLTCMDVTENNELCPFVAPVNHNFLNEAKTLSIAHTMMGNFCHGNDKKESQMENMGTDACIIVGFDNKVRLLSYLFPITFFSISNKLIIIYRMSSTTLMETGFL
jgi:hypothetical protein